MAEVFQIGSVRVMPGERNNGEVIVTQRADGSNITIPVILVRGKTDGAVLCVNGGIHGDDFAGIEAVMRLAHELEPESLCGTLVAVPVVNYPAYNEASRTNHFDHLDLNRTFPGSPTGTVTQQIAHVFLNEIIIKCSAMLDLHSGGGYARVADMVIAQGGYEQLIWDMALATGLEVVWLGGPWKGTGRISALEAGVQAITFESGGGLARNEGDIVKHQNAAINVMRYLKMLPGEPEIRASHRIITGGTTYAHRGGFFTPLVAGGDVIKAGQVVCRISEIFGNVVEELQAVADGIVCEMREVPTIKPGESACILGKYVENQVDQ
jgi:predicted deacylase